MLEREIPKQILLCLCGNQRQDAQEINNGDVGPNLRSVKEAGAGQV